MKPIFPTEKNSNKEAIILKNTFNKFPAFMATGGEIIFISDDFLEVHLEFHLTETTKNYHGTGFGGAIYSSLDPIYPLQLCHILGDDYSVWDLAANIQYLKPIDKNVYAKFLLTLEHIDEIKEKIKVKNKAVVELPVEYRDLDNNIYAKATKTIYIADKVYFMNRNKS
ncbi:PaaI family thioesterase [Pseudofrancisella aestuarii]|uniref:PaaI family thioesterase n=1 Tax=Pseudofrancisella aestuarii TaxID=2670347 RepID=A0ABV9TBQ8_9GAMM|nr:DUF4442 domain-containing protein [Pseudofrancisella aestuarii]